MLTVCLEEGSVGVSAVVGAGKIGPGGGEGEGSVGVVQRGGNGAGR